MVNLIHLILNRRPDPSSQTQEEAEKESEMVRDEELCLAQAAVMCVPQSARCVVNLSLFSSSSSSSFFLHLHNRDKLMPEIIKFFLTCHTQPQDNDSDDSDDSDDNDDSDDDDDDDKEKQEEKDKRQQEREEGGVCLKILKNLIDYEIDSCGREVCCYCCLFV